MTEELRPTDFVDYRIVFSEALILVGKGMSVSEALESCIKDSFPLTSREILAEARLILSLLKEETGWGSLRALRELAAQADLYTALRKAALEKPSPRGKAQARRHDAIADYPRVFSLAQRKRQSGFSLEDSLDMAARELYPQTFRKVKEAALTYVRLAARERGTHELRALRDLAEDPLLFAKFEDLPPE